MVPGNVTLLQGKGMDNSEVQLPPSVYLLVCLSIIVCIVHFYWPVVYLLLPLWRNLSCQLCLHPQTMYRSIRDCMVCPLHLCLSQCPCNIYWFLRPVVAPKPSLSCIVDVSFYYMSSTHFHKLPHSFPTPQSSIPFVISHPIPFHPISSLSYPTNLLHLQSILHPFPNVTPIPLKTHTPLPSPDYPNGFLLSHPNLTLYHLRFPTNPVSNTNNP